MLRVIHEKGSVPVKIWASDLDEATENQLRRIAKMPFIEGSIPAMADAHLGKGATIGTVLPTRGALIPAAVGVDLGCFTEDTKVVLTNGEEQPLSQLVGKKLEVWSCTPEGQIYAAKATCKLTRRNQQLIRIKLDNNRSIDCTLDHEFLLRDGTYKKAADLRKNDSLMPFYSDLDKDGYTRILQPKTRRYQRAHWIVARSGLMGDIPKYEGQTTIIHHLDFNKQNNDVSNLIFMGDKEHSHYHRTLSERNKYGQSPDFENKRIAAIRAKAKTPEGYKEISDRGTANLLAYMRSNPEHFKRGKEYLIKYNKSIRGREKSKETSNRILTCPDCNSRIKSYIALHTHKKTVHRYNHKVISARRLNKKRDVFCLSVPGYNNFALAAGVFVHNCGMSAVRLPFKVDELGGDKKLRELRASIERSVPTGRFSNNSVSNRVAQTVTGIGTTPGKTFRDGKGLTLDDREMKVAMSQCGSLGGGNHFIEVCTDTDGNA